MLKHPIVREVLTYFDLSSGVEILSIADIPSKGSGLGSSSSFTVSVINAVATYLNLNISKEKIAENAFKIESNLSEGAIGRQDQFAATFGGINSIIFRKDSSVFVEPFNLEDSKIQLLKNSMLLLYTGKTRNASKLLAKQNELTKVDKKTKLSLHAIKELCEEGSHYLEHGDPKSVGLTLGKSWALKKSIQDGISSNEIDQNYVGMIKRGAWGGKLLGAGGGGFFLVMAPREIHSEIVSSVSNWRPIDFEFDSKGATINQLT
jgi:D-glycero-alpha-D-manno-heptose-7-phosphate kinase